MNRSELFIAIALQCVATLVVALVALAGFSATNAWHALLGGAAATIPNGLFALRLAVHRGRRPESYPVVLFVGELLKIAASIALLALVVRQVGADLRWGALLAGWIFALKAPLAVPVLMTGTGDDVAEQKK